MQNLLMTGGTSYDDQSLEDIKNDILNWIEYSQKIKGFFSQSIKELKDNNYWSNVPFAFAAWCIDIPRICNSFISDFNSILNDINNDNINQRTIKLMQKIGQNAHTNWKDFRTAYKEDYYWKDYENAQFKQVEKLYQDGGDFFGTLFDVSNAACRMEDYMNTSSKTINNISIGDGNNITNSNIQAGNNNQQITNANNSCSFDYEAALQFISEIKKAISEETIKEGDKKEALEILEDIDNSIKEKKKPSFIKSALTGLKDFLIQVGSGLAVSIITAKMNGLIQ